MNVFTQWIKRVFKRQHEPLLSQEETNALIKDVTTDYLKTAVSIVLRTVPHTTLDGKPNPRWIMGVAPGFPDYDVEALIGVINGLRKEEDDVIDDYVFRRNESANYRNLDEELQPFIKPAVRFNENNKIEIKLLGGWKPFNPAVSGSVRRKMNEDKHFTA